MTRVPRSPLDSRATGGVGREESGRSLGRAREPRDTRQRPPARAARRRRRQSPPELTSDFSQRSSTRWLAVCVVTPRGVL